MLAFAASCRCGPLLSAFMHAPELPFQGVADLENDEAVGFQLISTDDIDDLGVSEIIRRIRARVGDSPVYLRSVAPS